MRCEIIFRKTGRYYAGKDFKSVAGTEEINISRNSKENSSIKSLIFHHQARSGRTAGAAGAALPGANKTKV